MITAQEFCDLLADGGFTFASGVPCSHFGGPIAHLSTEPGRYVPAPNEGRTPVWATSSIRSLRW